MFVNGLLKFIPLCFDDEVDFIYQSIAVVVARSAWPVPVVTDETDSTVPVGRPFLCKNGFLKVVKDKKFKNLVKFKLLHKTGSRKTYSFLYVGL